METSTIPLNYKIYSHTNSINARVNSKVVNLSKSTGKSVDYFSFVGAKTPPVNLGNDDEVYSDEAVKSFVTLNSSVDTAEVKAKVDSLFLFELLSNEPFTPGYLSNADRYFESKFKDVSKSNAISLLNDVSMLCYADSKNHAYLHFLNVLKNATFYMSYDDLKLYALLSIGNGDCEIKDLAISMFESFNYENEAALNNAIELLRKSDTSGYPWLTEYKNEIIEELSEESQRYQHG